MNALGVVAVLAACLGACGGATEGSADASDPPATTSQQSKLLAQATGITSVHFTTSTTVAANSPPDADVTVKDAETARALYERVLSLEAIPAGAIAHCPFASGVVYTLTFNSGDAVSLVANVTPDGCQWVTSPQLDSSLSVAGAFWSDLATSLAVSEARIYPYQPSASK